MVDTGSNSHHLCLRVVVTLLPSSPVTGSTDIEETTWVSHLSVNVIHRLQIPIPILMQKFGIIREKDIVVCPNHGPHMVRIRVLLA